MFFFQSEYSFIHSFMLMLQKSQGQPPGIYKGVSLNGGKTPISHLKSWSFLVGKPMGLFGKSTILGNPKPPENLGSTMGCPPYRIFNRLLQGAGPTLRGVSGGCLPPRGYGEAAPGKPRCVDAWWFQLQPPALGRGSGDPPHVFQWWICWWLEVPALKRPQRNCTQRSRVDLGFEIDQTQHPAQAKWQDGDVGEEKKMSKNYRVFRLSMRGLVWIYLQ